MVIVDHDRGPWFHLSDVDTTKVQERLDELLPIWTSFIDGGTVKRTGQALEIAIYRAILAAEPQTHLFGGFSDLDAHDDSTLYSKQELQNFNGASLGKEALDFVIGVGGDFCGIEVKNVRPWYYAHDEDIRNALRKCLRFRVIPVFIARRIQYVTFRVLGTCGVILHETYNQRLAAADTLVADMARDKRLLGYHDIRVSNEPDNRLTRFFNINLPAIIPAAKQKLEQYHDLLSAYAFDNMRYREFSGRVRRRELGQKEDNDWPEDEEQEGFDDERG